MGKFARRDFSTNLKNSFKKSYFSRYLLGVLRPQHFESFFQGMAKSWNYIFEGVTRIWNYFFGGWPKFRTILSGLIKSMIVSLVPWRNGSRYMRLGYLCNPMGRAKTLKTSDFTTKKEFVYLQTSAFSKTKYPLSSKSLYTCAWPCERLLQNNGKFCSHQ